MGIISEEVRWQIEERKKQIKEKNLEEKAEAIVNFASSGRAYSSGYAEFKDKKAGLRIELSIRSEEDFFAPVGHDYKSIWITYNREKVLHIGERGEILSYIPGVWENLLEKHYDRVRKLTESDLKNRFGL